MNWSTILPSLHLFQLILSAVSPALKQAALAELRSLAAQDAANPLLVLLLQEAEKLVSAA